MKDLFLYHTKQQYYSIYHSFQLHTLIQLKDLHQGFQMFHFQKNHNNNQYNYNLQFHHLHMHYLMNQDKHQLSMLKYSIYHYYS